MNSYMNSGVSRFQMTTIVAPSTIQDFVMTPKMESKKCRVWIHMNPLRLGQPIAIAVTTVALAGQKVKKKGFQFFSSHQSC